MRRKDRDNSSSLENSGSPGVSIGSPTEQSGPQYSWSEAEKIYSPDDPEVLASLIIDYGDTGQGLPAGYIAAIEKDEKLKQELADFRLIRSGVQDWFKAVEADAARVAGKSDLWSRIEFAIKEDAMAAGRQAELSQNRNFADWAGNTAVRRRQNESFLLRADRLFGKLFGFGADGGDRWSWRDAIAYGSSAGVVAILILFAFNFSFQNRSPDSGRFAARDGIGQDSTEQQAANLGNSVPQTLQNGGVLPGAAILAAGRPLQNQDGSGQLAVRDVSIQGTVPVVGGLSGREIQIDRLLQRSRLASVLRTDGAEIEWIRSDRGFNLMPSANGKAPPAIWIARAAAGPR